jgi:hypothetical protein
MRSRLDGLISMLVVAGATSLPCALALAQTTSASAPATTAAPLVKPATSAGVTVAGYVEAFYQWNFNRPSIGINIFS